MMMETEGFEEGKMYIVCMQVCMQAQKKAKQGKVMI